MRKLYWLDDEAWARIEPHLPRGRKGAHRVDDRRVLSGSGSGVGRGRDRDCLGERRYGARVAHGGAFNFGNQQTAL